jgi:hypothetical protein
MKKQQRTQVLVGILLAVTVFAAVFLTRNGQADGKPPPSASGYYSGPMKNKWGTLTTEEGKLVQNPNGTSPSPSEVSKASTSE